VELICENPPSPTTEQNQIGKQMNYALLVIIFTSILLVGAIGTIIPALPGIPLMFAATLIFLIFDKFDHLTILNLVVFLLIALASITVDYFSGIIGAKYGGAGRNSLIIGLLGLILGILLYPPFGGIAGLFTGIMVAEIIQYKDHKKAIKAATGGVAGVVLGTVVNFILAILFLVLFIIFAAK
jgi:uncharacterized protein YqgC (DUF456 family)